MYRVVSYGDRDIVNYSGLIIRSSISFLYGNLQNIILKYGEEMWCKVKVLNHFNFCILFKLLF